VQEAKFNVAQADLNAAQAQLDAKQKELDVVQAVYDAAMKKKQVNSSQFKCFKYYIFLCYCSSACKMKESIETCFIR